MITRCLERKNRMNYIYVVTGIYNAIRNLLVNDCVSRLV